MAFVLVPLNHGDGTGGSIICDQFAQGGNTAMVVFSGMVFGPIGGPYTSVSTANPLPIALPAGANNLGYMTPAAPGTTTGATPFHTISAANTTPVQVKGAGGTSSAGTLYDIIGFNVSASVVAFVKLYDTAAAPTVGTTVPAYVLPLPTAGSTNGAGAARSWPVGLKFTNGIWLAITGGMADNDNTAPAAGQVLVDGSFA